MSVVRGYWVLALGIVVLAVGIVPLLTYAMPVTYAGWTAYAPLTSTTFTPSIAPVIWTAQVAAGIALIAGWIGYRIGRRRKRSA